MGSPGWRERPCSQSLRASSGLPELNAAVARRTMSSAVCWFMPGTLYASLRAKRSNPQHRVGRLDCFASLAMTARGRLTSPACGERSDRLGDANGSRERAPDDRLRIVRCDPGEGDSPRIRYSWRQPLTPTLSPQGRGEGAHRVSWHDERTKVYSRRRTRSSIMAWTCESHALRRSGSARSIRM